MSGEKTLRHPAEDACDFWHSEVTRLRVDLDEARRELADLERHWRETIARIEAARLEGIEAAARAAQRHAVSEGWSNTSALRFRNCILALKGRV